jgi:prefoldin alpha subunit
MDGLDVQKLSQARAQLEDEIDHLTTSFNQLRAAQAKFKECFDSVQADPLGQAGTNSHSYQNSLDSSFTN